MKLRLEIVVGRGFAERIERCSSRVRLGRDPEGEVVFSGPDTTAVSWQHAEIELASVSAIIDCDSTNGTLVNFRRITSRTQLCVGDLIQLGTGGPRLKVLALEGAAAGGRRAMVSEERVKASSPPDPMKETEHAAPFIAAAPPHKGAAARPRTPWLAIGGVGVAVFAVLALAWVLLRQ